MSLMVGNATDADLATPEWYLRLRERIARLIETDIESLWTLLYRVDMPEEAVKKALAENPTRDADDVFAELLLRRELQKRQTREAFRKHDAERGDEEMDDEERL